jgi:hypothetical protein
MGKRRETSPEISIPLRFLPSNLRFVSEFGFRVSDFRLHIENCMMYKKGLPLSTFEDNAITLAGDKLSGRLAGDLKVWSRTEPCKIEWEGRRFGNRMILGDYTLTWGEMVITNHLRGGIVAEGAPPLVNLDPSIREAGKPAIDAWKAKKRAAQATK